VNLGLNTDIDRSLQIPGSGVCKCATFGKPPDQI